MCSNMEKIIEKVSSFWIDILHSDNSFSKQDARKLLLDYAKELDSFEEYAYSDIKNKIYQIIFGMLRILEKSPDKKEDLKVTAII